MDSKRKACSVPGTPRAQKCPKPTIPIISPPSAWEPDEKYLALKADLPGVFVKPFKGTDAELPFLAHYLGFNDTRPLRAWLHQGKDGNSFSTTSIFLETNITKCTKAKSSSHSRPNTVRFSRAMGQAGSRRISGIFSSSPLACRRTSTPTLRKEKSQ